MTRLQEREPAWLHSGARERRVDRTENARLFFFRALKTPFRREYVQDTNVLFCTHLPKKDELVFTNTDVPGERLCTILLKSKKDGLSSQLNHQSPLFLADSSCRPHLLFLPASLPPVELTENGGNHRIGKQEAVRI